jgi:uncharacterized membrane-anchored protein
MRLPALNIWLAMFLVAGLQSAALGYMIFDRAQLIAHGREIVLDTRPVDPRSLFRGDYVILNYGQISRLPREIAKDPNETRDTVFVTLRKDTEDWRPVSVSDVYPEVVVSEDVVLKGVQEPFSSQVRYGIESYFVAEGEGKRLEKLIRKGQLQVVVAVGPDGRAGIKGLVVDGKRIYDEPLF